MCVCGVRAECIGVYGVGSMQGVCGEVSVECVGCVWEGCVWRGESGDGCMHRVWSV